MESLTYKEFESGRCFLGRLPHGEDLLTTIEGFCGANSIQTGVFSVIGAVTSVTLGGYDQNQQVYVTQRRDEHLEIVHCAGNVSLKDGKAAVHAHAVLAGLDGQTPAGHLFSETRVFAGEIYIRELLGRPPEREYDDKTGLFLWRL